MPDDTDNTPRQQFARDLRRIREDRGVSKGEIQAATQVSTAQLDAFEEGTIFGQPSMNRVYVRAFVRAYAEAIGLPVEETLDQFDAAFDGHYDGELAAQFIDRPSSATEPEGTSSLESDSIRSREEDSGPDAEPEPSSSEEEPPQAEGAPPPESSDEVASARAEDQQIPDAEEKPSSAPSWLEESESTHSEDDAAPVSSDSPPLSSETPSEGHTSSTGGSPHPPRSRGFWTEVWSWVFRHQGRLLAGAVILLLIVAIGGLGISYIGNSGSAPADRTGSQGSSGAQASEAKTAPDTSDSSPEVRPPASITLGDTLFVKVLATANVREMRVQRDDDLRRPYWIEEQEATVFPFTRRIIIENQLENARIFLEGYPFPRSQTDSQGRIVIDRQTAQTFADTLRGSPPAVSVETDTAALLQPPPAENSE